ncbi:MAG: serine protease, partial [Eubacterium sp.]|nr:serine protease [Eubacterium sp.]
MKKTRISFIFLSLFLVCAMAVNLTGCTMPVQKKDLMEGVTCNEIGVSDNLIMQNANVTDFSIRLFKASETKGGNTLISPLSVLCALAMTANGAEAETREQMEAVLGMTTEELNPYLYSYMKKLPQGEEYKLSLANSIWVTEDEHFKLNQDFLQTNSDYYGADVYKVPFNNQTCKDINNWIKQKTDEMIPKILDEVPSQAVMYLVNALAFEAEWSEIYEKEQVEAGKFTKEDGTK